MRGIGRLASPEIVSDQSLYGFLFLFNYQLLFKNSFQANLSTFDPICIVHGMTHDDASCVISSHHCYDPTCFLSSLDFFNLDAYTVSGASSS